MENEIKQAQIYTRRRNFILIVVSSILWAIFGIPWMWNTLPGCDSHVDCIAKGLCVVFINIALVGLVFLLRLGIKKVPKWLGQFIKWWNCE